MGRRIAENLRERRRALGLSLDELAGNSGVSRAALSQIETRRTNPSLSVLWKVAVGLGFSFSDLVGEGPLATSLLRRSEGESLHSPDGTFQSRPLARAGVGPGVEAYELQLAGHASYASDAHGTGTRELIVVLAGALRMTVAAETHILDQGDSLTFSADQAHVYANPAAGRAVYYNVIVYRR
jgi:XRE family transcriptional regulator, regulator of sulfur utilization